MSSLPLTELEEGVSVLIAKVYRRWLRSEAGTTVDEATKAYYESKYSPFKHPYTGHHTYTGPGCAMCGLNKELHSMQTPIDPNPSDTTPTP